MSEIFEFDSKHGKIRFEVDGDDRIRSDGMIPKSGLRMSADEQTVVKSHVPFERALSSLEAYVASVQDVISAIETAPKEVSMEVGLKLRARASFFSIATAGTEADIKLKLVWEPQTK